MGPFAASRVISQLPENQFETLEGLNQLDKQINAKVKQDAPNDTIARDLSKAKIIHIVCKDEQGVGGGEDATLIENFVIVCFPVLIRLKLNDVDDSDLGHEYEGHHLKSWVIAEHYCNQYKKEATHHKEEVAHQYNQSFCLEALVE